MIKIAILSFILIFNQSSAWAQGNYSESLTFDPGASILKSGAVFSGLVTYRARWAGEYEVQAQQDLFNDNFELKITGGTSVATDLVNQQELKTFLILPFTGTVFIGMGLSWSPEALSLGSETWFKFLDGFIKVRTKIKSNK